MALRRGMIPLLLFVFTPWTGATDCQMDDKECEFTWWVDQKLTMMHNSQLVYPDNGQLFSETQSNETVIAVGPNGNPINETVHVRRVETVPVEEVITGDGFETPRLVTVVNGQLPGPDIIVYEGQTVIVHVTNRLKTQAVTIHWHGLNMRSTPAMDGVPWVTQCPIYPGQSFTYRFKAEPKGTFWWHSHVGGQRSDGVFGAFIIKDRIETIVEDKIMQIQDWNHDYGSETAYMKALHGEYIGRKPWINPHSLDGSFFSSFHIQSGLINGRGRYYYGNGTSNEAPLTVYTVKRGQTYRFRVIGVGVVYPFRVSVDNHDLTVVASDGYDLEPVVAESFIINPGERFDFTINATQSVDNYWIRAATLEEGTPHQTHAILRYEGAYEIEPDTHRMRCRADRPCRVLNCPFSTYPLSYVNCMTFDELKALATNDPAPEYTPGKFKEFFLNFGFPGVTSFPASINGRRFDTPDVNPLTQPKEWSSPCKEPECGEGKHCKCTFALSVGNNDTVQMVFLNMGRGKGWSHPIHMHGHSFYVVKMGYGHYDPSTGHIIGDNTDIDCRGKSPYNTRNESFCNNATWTNQRWLDGKVPLMELDRPPRKDTIIVPTGGYVVIRIRADNPGLWNMHCHIELHNLAGMQMLINESFSDYPTPPEGIPECYSYPPSEYRMAKIQEAKDISTRLPPPTQYSVTMTTEDQDICSSALYTAELNETIDESSPLAGCLYKGELHGEGETWKDDCDSCYKCSCLDGQSHCSNITCINWNLPFECQLYPPTRGKCCETPNCPPNIVIEYPPGYIEE